MNRNSIALKDKWHRAGWEDACRMKGAEIIKLKEENARLRKALTKERRLTEGLVESLKLIKQHQERGMGGNLPHLSATWRFANDALTKYESERKEAGGMNEAEARKTLRDTKGTNTWTPSTLEHRLRAEGYLEAIEKAKVLVDCLKEIQRKYQSYSGDTDQDIEEALAKWKEVK